MDVVINLIVVNILQCRCVANHNTYTLNIYTIICQLFLNKARGTKREDRLRCRTLHQCRQKRQTFKPQNVEATVLHQAPAVTTYHLPNPNPNTWTGCSVKVQSENIRKNNLVNFPENWKFRLVNYFGFITFFSFNILIVSTYILIKFWYLILCLWINAIWF